MIKEFVCHSWVKAKSQTKTQLQTLSCREVSSEEVKKAGDILETEGSTDVRFDQE